MVQRRVQVAHGHVARRVVQQELQLGDGDARLQCQRGIGVPQRVPREAVQLVLRHLGDVPRLRVGGEQPRALAVELGVLGQPVAEQISKRTRQRQVERSGRAALGLGYVQAPCAEV